MAPSIDMLAAQAEHQQAVQAGDDRAAALALTRIAFLPR